MMKQLWIPALAVAGVAFADMHVAPSIALAAASSKPQPEYSALARQLKVTGDVSVEVKITIAGEVESVKVLSGNAMLSAPVVRTVKTWRFKPFQQDGQPTVATTVLRFNFK